MVNKSDNMAATDPTADEDLVLTGKCFAKLDGFHQDVNYKRCNLTSHIPSIKSITMIKSFLNYNFWPLASLEPLRARSATSFALNAACFALPEASRAFVTCSEQSHGFARLPASNWPSYLGIPLVPSLNVIKPVK
jgi:hypothetical protein